MNDHQKKFVETLENHLIQKVSITQMDTWLTEHIKPSIFSSRAYKKPGMWLEMYAYREIHWHIVDLENSGKAEEANLDWYWEEVKRILNLLVGNSPFKRTEYRMESPMKDRTGEDIQLMRPYLEYAEKIASILFEDNAQADLPNLDINFEPDSISFRTCSEFLMDEILNTIREYKETDEHLRHHPSDNYYSPELRFFQISQLRKLLQCFRGELRYSISASFEGLDKFAVTIVV